MCIMNKSIIVMCITLVLLLPRVEAAASAVTVEVSNLYSAIHHAISGTINPGESEFSGLDRNKYHDRYLAHISIRKGHIKIIGFDGVDIRSNNKNPTYLIDKAVYRSGYTWLPFIPTDQGVGVWFFNVGQAPADVDITVYRVGKRPESVTNKIKKIVENPVLSLEKFYALPRFKLAIKPCGIVNAYSGPDITICTELFADLYEKNAMDALEPIILHELAHTLLYLWGLPGYDNEDVADDFAAAFLAMHAPKHIDALIRWLEQKDSTTEAAMQLINGDKHTISIQRARNLKAKLRNPREITERWGRLLAPHTRRFPLVD